MILQIVINKTKPYEKSAYVKASLKFVKDLSMVPGCLGAQVYSTVEDKENVAIVVKWESSEAINSEGATKAFLKNKSNLKSHFVSNTTQLYKLIE